MNSVIDRIETLIELECLSTNAFARKVDTDPGNLGKMLAGKQTITDKTLRKIADVIGCNFEWLKYGEGEMMQPGSVNQTVRGKGNTAIAGNGNAVNQEAMDSLLQQLAEKDRQIAQLLSLLEEKDRQINQLLQIIANYGK